MKRLFIIFTILFYISPATKAQSNQQILIAAASDLKFALDSVITVFKKANADADIKVSYGSSGQFCTQIQNSAPFDIFFSADIQYPQLLKEKGLTITDTKIYGIGKLVIWSKKIDPNQKQLNSLLDPAISKIAIANPEHAPYGKRAVESLNYYKIYDNVKDKLVFGENIAQTAQFVTTGSADIGIIALSLALSPTMQQLGGKYYLIPEKSHQLLEQGYVILKHGESNQLAKKFYDFAASKAAIAILSKYGFTQK